jgi:ABC-2 type transport system permease protein
VVSSFFSAKFHHSVEEMLVSPLPNNIILLGFVAGGVARGLIVGFIATVVSMYFSQLQVHSYLVTFSVVILTSVLFSLAGFINAAYARSFDDITIIPTFVLTPLIYLGGVFYSIKMLPEIWQQISLVNPILYMVNAFHYGILGVSDINVSTAFIIIIAFIVVLYFFALRLLRLGVGLKP